MNATILATKLCIPPPRSKLVQRQRLLERLNEGLQRKLTLVSASAGFGKTTLVSEWLAGSERSAAWLSLDEGDNDPTRFLTYLIAALQTIVDSIGEGVLTLLQSPQPPSTESILTAVLNEVTSIPEELILVLDDYHVIDSPTIDQALTFLLDHLPPQLHLVIITREDPPLPLARLRVRNQLTELRVSDLRFTTSEATAFLNQTMDLNLSSADINLLEFRTEGWIAGLQLAAISMQGNDDVSSFIQTFTGSHHFVLDYLFEEVLQRQSNNIQTFLLHTSILDRMCGPLCDAVLGSSSSGQEILEYLKWANLFTVPLDNERRWYRYHHLFADLLRQRLQQSVAKSTGEDEGAVADLHIRASIWYEANGLEIEALQHAAAANDVERAARLVEGNGMPLHFRGGVAAVLNWLDSLRTTVLDARPSLWVIYASALLMVGQLTRVEQKLQAAEVAIKGVEPDDSIHDLIGHIASIRATLAVSQHQVEAIMVQSLRALEYLHPSNLPVRTATTWTLGYAYHLQGDRTAASQAYTEAISNSQAIGHIIITIMATIGLGNIQEAENQLHLAAQTYRNVLPMAGDPPLLFACEAHLGLARIYYEWNDMDAAERHLQQSVQLAQQLEHTDRFVDCEVFLARLKLAKGDLAGAAAALSKAAQFVLEHNFVYRLPEVAAAQVLTLLRQGHVEAAAHLAQKHELPISQSRVHLAEGDATSALVVLEPLQREMEAKNWKDEQLRVMLLQAMALNMLGDKDKAKQMLRNALILAESGGFIRIFIDEGIPMAQLLSVAVAQGIMSDYIDKLLVVFAAEKKSGEKLGFRVVPSIQPLIEPLSERELYVLQLISQGYSNREISELLYLALDTVKGHNRRIFGKLQVQRRTEAVARARELGLL
jgi:LuxR family maltose regulon positive regulatory protein